MSKALSRETASVAVTGATGFVGRHLTALLLEAGFRVVALGRRDPKITGVAFRPCAALEEMTVREAWAAPLAGVDYIVHLAAIAHQWDTPPSAEVFMRANAEATAALAEAARDMKVRRLLFVSSIGAVATFSDTPITPDTPCMPDSDYGRSKREAERAIARTLGPDTKTDYCILRPHLVYGPGNPGNMARLLSILEKGLPLPLASIANRRSFIYVGNLCTLILCALEREAVSCGAFPVADPEPLSTPELLQAIGAATGWPVRLFPCPLPVLQMTARGLDSALWLIGKAPKGFPALERLSNSLSTDMAPTLTVFGYPELVETREGIARSFAPKVESC